MSLFDSPPRSTKYAFRKGDNHLGVWALQRFLNKTFDISLAEDGHFGIGTELEVKHYQRAKSVAVDGIVGPRTQERIVRSCIVRVPHGASIPAGLLEGMIAAESGRLIAACNSQVSGGVDLGLTQRRVLGPPYDPAKVMAAMDPYVNIERSAGELFERYRYCRARLRPAEYIWRVAALAHNWPAAAETLYQGKTISTTKRADWAPSSVRFDDGAPVISWRDWAEFYALGSYTHNHPGMVTRLAFGVPTR